MDILIKLFNMFNAAAGALVKYIPQNKEDVLAIFKQGWDFVGTANLWLGNTFGVDIQKLISAAAAFAVKYFTVAFNFIIELLKKLAEEV